MSDEYTITSVKKIENPYFGVLRMSFMAIKSGNQNRNWSSPYWLYSCNIANGEGKTSDSWALMRVTVLNTTIDTLKNKQVNQNTFLFECHQTLNAWSHPAGNSFTIYEGKERKLSINIEIFPVYLVQTCIFTEKPSEISQMCFRHASIILH